MLVLPLFCNAQQFVHGKVVDAHSNIPLEGANVFISQTTYATITDAEGRFAIQVPENKYQLLVSYVGYQEVLLGPAAFPDRLVRYTIPLSIDLEQLREVTIVPAKVRERYVRLFLDNLIGTSRNAQKTKLHNIADVMFEFDKETQTLRAWSDNPLEITIPALNYKLLFVLEDFHLDLKNRVSYYKGYPSYSELNTFNSKKKKIVANRLRAYNGSMMHFIRTLQAGTMSEEGFTAKAFTKKENPAWPGDSAVAKMYEQARQMKDFTLLKRIPPKQLIEFEKHEWYAGDLIRVQDGHNYLVIPDHIQITYTKETPESDYLSHGHQSRFQVSQLRSNGKEIEFFANGALSEPDALVHYGYMGWEKLADTLPFDYNP